MAELRDNLETSELSRMHNPGLGITNLSNLYTRLKIKLGGGGGVEVEKVWIIVVICNPIINS